MRNMNEMNEKAVVGLKEYGMCLTMINDYGAAAEMLTRIDAWGDDHGANPTDLVNMLETYLIDGLPWRIYDVFAMRDDLLMDDWLNHRSIDVLERLGGTIPWLAYRSEWETFVAGDGKNGLRPRNWNT